MNLYKEFPSMMRESYIDLGLYRPEPDTPVSDWIEYALLIENPEIVVKKRTVENLGFILDRLPYFESAETEPCEEEESRHRKGVAAPPGPAPQRPRSILRDEGPPR